MSTLLNTVSGARGVDALVSLTMQCESPGSSAHMQAAFTSYSACLLCRADNGGATAEAAPPTREYIFLCGEVLDDETGTERVLTPSEPRRAVWDADEVASAVVEAEQASAALPAASVQQQQQQQWPQPLHEASAAQPQDASAAHAPGVQQQASLSPAESPFSTDTGSSRCRARRHCGQPDNSSFIGERVSFSGCTDCRVPEHAAGDVTSAI